MKNEQIKSNIPKMSVHVSKRNEIPDLVYCPLHYHEELEFLIIYEGDFIMVVDDVEYVAHPGEIVFVNSGVPHRTYSKVPVRSALIQFREGDFIDHDIVKAVKYSTKLNNLAEFKVKIIKNDEIFNAIDGIYHEVNAEKTAYEIYVRSYIYRILASLYRTGILVDSEHIYNTKETQKILPIISYLNKNFNENISLEEASNMLNFDPSYFCRIFKSAIGATFTEYLNFVRVCKAEKLLAKTNNSILEISEAVGFSSVSYFNRVFKKYRNCSPRAYRTTEYKNI